MNGPRLARSYESSESAMITYRPCAPSMPAMSAPPYPRIGASTTRAPLADRDLLRPVGGTVVGDQNLAVDAEVGQALDGLLDAGREGLRLVEARQQDRDLDTPSQFCTMSPLRAPAAVVSSHGQCVSARRRKGGESAISDADAGSNAAGC